MKTPSIDLLQRSGWNWNTSLYKVSADHTSIEKIPNRASNWHVNVNSFVEPPGCDNCLLFGKPQIQPDGTIKVKITLRHPFPLKPLYTGFDVRGTIMFPATRYWRDEPGNAYDGNWEKVFDNFIPLYFSRSEDGGGQLLNADGFTMYLFPGLDLPPHLPISQYSKGQNAYGPDPDSTINGYKLFTKDPERRMFRVYDTISRTYHIAPPDGEFIFGYVVDASWAAPTTFPVTDPMNDFPRWANCEDGYVLELEQLVPFYTGTYDAQNPPSGLVDREIIKTTLLINTPYPSAGISASLFCPDITPDPAHKTEVIANQNGTDGWLDSQTVITTPRIVYGNYEAPPGEYVALLFVSVGYYDPDDPNPKQFGSVFFFDFIKLQVEEGSW